MLYKIQVAKSWAGKRKDLFWEESMSESPYMPCKWSNISPHNQWDTLGKTLDRDYMTIFVSSKNLLLPFCELTSKLAFF